MEKIDVKTESRNDGHWVENLFPPRFTFQNLLESLSTQQYESSKDPPVNQARAVEEPHRSSRRKLYQAALQEVQQMEMEQKKEALGVHDLRGSNSGQNEIELCLWNEKDLSKLRVGFAEVKRDRWQLKQQLNCAEEQLKAEHKKRMWLQSKVEMLEDQLSIYQKKITHQDLEIKHLKSESQALKGQIQTLTTEVREKVEEADQWKTTLQKAIEDMQEVEQERVKLAWELERQQARWRSEGERLDKAAQIEPVLLRLESSLRQTQADLDAERERHTRSRTALDIFQRHFSSK
ncbi:hypothetical protein DNTS_024185 [Danionella cerebrum]|uniref:Uncharacterized protein n=1 Tax=Danionella cerebrum TaxID=2873325 RepID=A0A553RIM7_9TELE|nr:hypothetical protein DNTS_024185 [Danionella translucida]